MDARCDVTASGQKLGEAFRQRGFDISLPPGDHTIACEQRLSGRRWSHELSLSPGQHIALRGSVLPPLVPVTVSLSLGDQIKINQKQDVRTGARLQLPVGRYRIEVFRNGQQIALGWADVRGDQPCTLRDQPQIRCD